MMIRNDELPGLRGGEKLGGTREKPMREGSLVQELRRRRSRIFNSQKKADLPDGAERHGGRGGLRPPEGSWENLRRNPVNVLTKAEAEAWT